MTDWLADYVARLNSRVQHVMGCPVCRRGRDLLMTKAVDLDFYLWERELAD